jgi:hypothetical protein
MTEPLRGYFSLPVGLRRQVGLEQKGTDLDGVAVVEGGFLDRLAVETGSYPAPAVLDAPAAAGAADDTMNFGDVGP